MNCLLIEEHEIDRSTNRARIVGRRRRHAQKILRAVVGDTLRVGVIGDRLGTGRVLGLDAQTLEMEIELEYESAPKRPLHLVLALPRPPVFRRLVSTIASLGVERLFVVNTARTEKSFWQSHVVESEAIRDRLLLGLEQTSDTVLPQVECHRSFKGLISEILPPCIEGRRALLAHPTATAQCPHNVNDPITIFVGPEGGFLDHEVEQLLEIGFEVVGLGPRVLRVEPIIPLLVGRLFD